MDELAILIIRLGWVCLDASNIMMVNFIANKLNTYGIILW
jgi:hypothetical protein